jgi:CheY-like chemotaxis protein
MKHVLTVLVVDDSSAMREILSAILEAGGYDVILAEDVNSGFAALSLQHPDVVLTDYNMPGLTGEDLVRRIRSDRAFDSIPVFAVSSEPDLEVRRRMERAGANAWFNKPISAVALLAVMDAVRRAGPLIAAEQPSAEAAPRAVRRA